MATNYIDSVKDKNGIVRPLRDNEAHTKADNLDDRVTELEENGGGSSSSSETSEGIVNINGGDTVRLWVGTQEQFNAISVYEHDVVYLIGTPTEGYVPPEPDEHTYFTITANQLSYCSLSSHPSRVEAGSPFAATLTPNGGYTLNSVLVQMYDSDLGSYVDITEDSVSYRDDDSYAQISIDEVTGNVIIVAVAIIPLTDISVMRLSSSDTLNTIKLRASLTPFTTTQTAVRWSIPDSASDFRIEYSGLSATIRVLSTADESSVVVTCTSIDKPSISGTITLSDISYAQPDPEVPDEPDEDDYIDFTGETDVKQILQGAGWGDSNGITIAQAKEAKLSKAECQALFKNNTSITKFDTWKYFTTSHFSVSGCTSLASVKVPLLEGTAATSSFTYRFGIKNTAITHFEIPEGYTSIDPITTDGVTGMQYPFADGATVKIQSITFPSTLTAANAQFKDLSGITELDFSDTVLTQICQQLCYNMSELLVVKFPDTLVSTGHSQIIRDCKKVNRIEFGTNFQYFGTSETAMGLFYDGSASGRADVTLVFHGTTPPSNFSLGNKNSQGVYIRNLVSILVPESAVSAYTSSAAFSAYASIISSIESEGNS